MNSVFIEGREISSGHPPYIIAELSANHNGKLQSALDTISEAKARGADTNQVADLYRRYDDH